MVVDGHFCHYIFISKIFLNNYAGTFINSSDTIGIIIHNSKIIISVIIMSITVSH